MRFKRFFAFILVLIFASTIPLGVSAATVVQGDFNNSGSVTAADAVHLLYYTLYGGNGYRLNSFADVNGDGYINSEDAVYLLYNSLYGDLEYPLYNIDVNDAHTVTFADFDGKILGVDTVTDGKWADEPDYPYRKGYDFIGWDYEFDSVTENMTVTAMYGAAENQIYIDYVDNGNGTTTAVFSINGNVNVAALELQMACELANATYLGFNIITNKDAEANFVDGVFYFSLMTVDDILESTELFSITFENASDDVGIVFDVIDSAVSDSTFSNITEANVVGLEYNG